MEFLEGYIKNPDKFRAGSVNISPFTTDDIFRNNYIWHNYKEDTDPVTSFEGMELTITASATAALDLALRDLVLTPDDEVWIVTTSGNKYISGCVTRTIEKYCRWSREHSARTAAILVNHEFGFIATQVKELTSYKLPIIEDAAYSMYSESNGLIPGLTGDYAIFSMAKMFPMQAGGLLFSNDNTIVQQDLSPEAVSYFKSCFKFYSKYRRHLSAARLDAFAKYVDAFGDADFEPRFIPFGGEVPGAFIFCAPGHDLDGLKTFMQGHGIECSVFYGEDAFYLPCHQNISAQHIDYFLTLIKDYLK